MTNNPVELQRDTGADPSLAKAEPVSRLGPSGFDPGEGARPDEPAKGTDVWYRGWECGYDVTAAFWGAEGWRAAKGGWDLDCRQTSGRTWPDLLDEIDAEEASQ